MPAVCEVCGSAPASHVCPICGRRVCEKHWRGDRCVVCAETLCQLCGSRLAVATCPVCGRLVCEECSVQVTPVIRVCKECYERGGWPSEAAQREPRRLASRLSSLLSVPRR